MKIKTGNYEDIINLSRPVSEKYKPMSIYDRAAQFSPFAALTGHEAAITETARITEIEKEAGEDMVKRLNEKLKIISENPGMAVTVLYFVHDGRKAGGTYREYSGLVKKIDMYSRTLMMNDEKRIPIDDIKDIKGEIIDSIMGIL